MRYATSLGITTLPVRFRKARIFSGDSSMWSHISQMSLISLCLFVVFTHRRSEIGCAEETEVNPLTDVAVESFQSVRFAGVRSPIPPVGVEHGLGEVRKGASTPTDIVRHFRD